MVSGVTQRHAEHLSSDHIPFTIELALASTTPAPRAAPTRLRRAWDQHRAPEAWQDSLAPALTAALAPLQPSLRALAQHQPQGASAQATIDTVYGQVEEALTDTCLQVVGTKVIRPTSLPWLSAPGVWEARQNKIAALRAVQRNRKDPALRHDLRTALHEWRRVSSEAKRQCYSSLCEQITSSPDSKLRWSLLKRVQPSSFTPLTSIANSSTGELPNSHAESLDNLCAAFIANGTPPPPSDPAAHAALEQQVADWASPAKPTIPDHPSNSWTFTEEDVKTQCTQQHMNSAPGPDAVLPAFLRHAGRSMWAALAAIYTFSWQHSVTPQGWKEANVMALYKGSGSKATAGSYRPISMTSILIRTFEHLVHKRLSAELESRHYFGKFQFGFRKGNSTIDAIHFLVTSIQDVLSRQPTKNHPALQCPVLFLDIQKAFDRVDHAILLQRVEAAGIRGRAWLWLRSFLTGRRMRCVDAAEYSDWQPVEYGVPQGCVLSPLLFLIFINQLQLDILSDPECNLIAPLFYADDGAMGPNPFTTTTTTTQSYEALYLQHLKKAISHLDAWCTSSRMRFGAEKSQIVIFTLRKRPDPQPVSNLRMCGFTISIADGYKYLGLHLTSKLSWTRAYEHALKQARRTAALITRVALATTSLSFAAVRTFVLGLIISSFSYAILFWGRPADLSAQQATALQAQVATPLRVALSLPRTAHQLGTLALCHVPTVAALAVKAQLSHLVRLSSPTLLPSSHPTRQLHDLSMQSVRDKPNILPWTALVPAAAVPLSVYLAAFVIPRLLLHPALGGRLDQPTRAAIGPIPPCPNYELGLQYWRQTGADRLTWAKANYLGQHLTTAIDWSIDISPRIPATAAAQLASSHTHMEWVATHEPLNPAPGGGRAIPHATSAPLTLCMPSPGLPPFLANRSPDTHQDQVRRARLLLNRSRTGTVRKRFAKVADANTISSHCTHCSTPTLPIDESIPHMLLACTRHAIARTQLVADLTALGVLTAAAPLTLSDILVASLPPRPLRKRHIPTLLRHTTTFLSAVHSDRAREQLVPLDTG